jgi:hypothetical protein
MQKNSILFLLLGFCLLHLQCKKDERDINLTVSPVSALYTPADNLYIQLKPAANLTETFEWEQAKAEDGSLVMYEVAFDQENGDFSKPFYTVLSDNKGLLNKLTITHGDLNKAAALGGADYFQKKKFRWTVLAYKGTNVVKATESRIVELERPGGFADIPGTLYLSGTATEAGNVLANALPMKQTAPGVFEIYTQLKAGSYAFYDGVTGSPRQFYVYDNNGIKAIGVNGQTTYSDATKVMRIRVDFNNINASYAEVKSIQLWYCDGNAFWFTLPYTGNGVWRYNNYTVNYKQESWGYEQRHKYKMVLNDGSGDTDLWLNYSSNDSPDQDGQYPHTVAYRTLNMDTNNGSQWDWAWKWDRAYMPQGTVADFWISLKASDAAYTMGYQKH